MTLSTARRPRMTKTAPILASLGLCAGVLVAGAAFRAADTAPTEAPRVAVVNVLEVLQAQPRYRTLLQESANRKNAIEDAWQHKKMDLADRRKQMLNTVPRSDPDRPKKLRALEKEA